MARTTTASARAALVTGLVAALAATAVACGPSATDDKDPDQRAFELDGRTLTVDADDSALEIVASDDTEEGTVEVTRWFKGSVAIGEDPKARWSMDGDRLVLRTDCSGFVSACSARHRIAVPRKVGVRVDNNDGSVRARGFKEALDITTADGSVDVTDSSGPLALRTGDGSIRADVTSRRVRARTSDGSVALELGAVPDSVDSRTQDGSVSITLPRAQYRVSTRTGDGAQEVSVPRDDSSSHVVKAETDDGKVTVRTAN